MYNLVSESNIYLGQAASNHEPHGLQLLQNITIYIARMLRLFGLSDVSFHADQLEAASDQPNRAASEGPLVTIIILFG